MTAEERAVSARSMEVYAGMVDRMDWNIGRVIDYLAETGELDDTVVIFMSDNGAEGAIVEAMPLRGAADRRADRKVLRQQPGQPRPAHVVHLVRPALGTSRHRAVAPAQGVHHRGRNPGRRLRHLAGLRPPAADRHRVQRPSWTSRRPCWSWPGTAHPGTSYRGREVAPMRGRSLVDYLSGAAETVHDADTGTGWELFGRRAIRQGDWKALYLPAPYGPGSWQLYDLASDPGEIDDLAGVTARQAGRAACAVGSLRRGNRRDPRSRLRV